MEWKLSSTSVRFHCCWSDSIRFVSYKFFLYKDTLLMRTWGLNCWKGWYCLWKLNVWECSSLADLFKCDTLGTSASTYSYFIPGLKEFPSIWLFSLQVAIRFHSLVFLFSILPSLQKAYLPYFNCTQMPQGQVVLNSWRNQSWVILSSTYNGDGLSRIKIRYRNGAGKLNIGLAILEYIMR